MHVISVSKLRKYVISTLKLCLGLIFIRSGPTCQLYPLVAMVSSSARSCSARAAVAVAARLHASAAAVAVLACRPSAALPWALAHMTPSFLVKKLSASFSPDATKRVVQEIRQLAKSRSNNRAFNVEGGAAGLLVPVRRAPAQRRRHGAAQCLHPGGQQEAHHARPPLPVEGVVPAPINAGVKVKLYVSIAGVSTMNSSPAKAQLQPHTETHANTM